ncbi:MAG: hypothetical protein ACYDBI_05835 [Thermoplasmataceae archaeon]
MEPLDIPPTNRERWALLVKLGKMRPQDYDDLVAQEDVLRRAYDGG